MKRAESQTPSEASLIKCPRCGLVSENLRCERCNALKITSCSGACSTCGLRTCVDPEKKKKSGG